MSVPNLSEVVVSCRNAWVLGFGTKELLCAYAHSVVVALHTHDPNFGHLRKVEGQNHCVDPLGRIVGVDVALYKPTGQIVDFIVSAGTGEGAPNAASWNVGPEGEYGEGDWIEPVDDGAVDPPGPTDPPGDHAALEQRVSVLERLVMLQQEQMVAIDARHVALHNELTQQMTGLNAGFAKVDRRRYVGKARLPFGLGTLTVNCEPVD